MVLTIILLAWYLGGQLPTTGPLPANCGQALTNALSSSTVDTCLGDDYVRQAISAKEERDRLRLLQTAAQHYRRAANFASSAETKARALNALAETYDEKHLNQLDQVEGALRELAAVQPEDLTHVFRLARLQETRGLLEAAEETLLGVRRAHPHAIDPYRMLTQFYSRRVVALQQESEPQTNPRVEAPPPLQRDENGIYRVGNGIQPPARLDIARYPADAKAAGVQGVVIAEVVVNEAGLVSDAKIVRSVPLLDDAALTAVRNWRYTPALVDGKAVPVKMTVTVNFTLAPPSAQPPGR
jgi:TonB family protein